MGYSCTARASYVEEAISDLIKKYFPDKGSNFLPGGGFYEIGREQPDGSITGSIYSVVADTGGKVRKTGSFKITAEGKIARWPNMPKDWKSLAEIRGAAKYKEVHETPRPRPLARTNSEPLFQII